MQEKRHILFLGLDHRLLWQLTRTLAPLEDQLMIDCVKDPGAAKEICDRELVHAIVVDGWEQAWQAAHHLGGDEAFEAGSWDWIILVESLPLECLPDGRPSPSAVFLEKPFNPKEFPSFLLKVIKGLEIREEEEVPEPVSNQKSLPLTPGESYQAPDGARVIEEGAEEKAQVEAQRVEPVADTDEASAFHQSLDQGFACLKKGDWKGAKEHWWKALGIRPNDRRLQANLRRLERMLEKRGGWD